MNQKRRPKVDDESGERTSVTRQRVGPWPNGTRVRNIESGWTGVITEAPTVEPEEAVGEEYSYFVLRDDAPEITRQIQFQHEIERVKE